MREEIYSDFGAAAADASSFFGIPIGVSDLHALISLDLLPSIPNPRTAEPFLHTNDVRRFAGSVFFRASIDGLFVDLRSLFGADDSQATERSREANPHSRVVFIRLSPTLGISFISGAVEIDRIQLFVAWLRSEHGVCHVTPGPRAPASLVRIDVDEAVGLWSLRPLIEERIRYWWVTSVSPNARISHTESLTVPSLYGNKSRITSFLTGVARRYVPDGAYVCDLMSGTGIVSRSFSRFFRIYANDANPFAALLTRSQMQYTPSVSLADVIHSLRASAERNGKELRYLFAGSLELEAGFLNGEINDTTLRAYQRFCADTHYQGSSSFTDPDNTLAPVASHYRRTIAELVAERVRDPNAAPYCMITGYYSNAYFGLAQGVALDSLRFAIDECTKGDLRKFCLAALLVTACSCASGPHFAQPPKINSLRNMAKLVERRARDVSTEFFLMLRLLAERQKTATGIEEVWNVDWREALRKCRDKHTDERPMAIYTDPPYTKLQYSRYYHVLDSILKFDYPEISGIGRYPPRQYRFSSRFEYQKTPALREFRQLFGECAGTCPILLLSYTENGMVPLKELVEEMSAVYRRIELFCKRITHHSQGVKVSKARQRNLEYVVVGSVV